MPATGNTSTGLHSTEVLLEAVTVCITHILNTDSLRAALPDALQAIARVVSIDRVVIIENLSTGTDATPATFFVWNSEEAPKVDAATLIANRPDRRTVDDWLSPLRKGEAVIGIRRLLTGPVRDLMMRLQAVSTLQVPIMLNGVYCGQIAFDDCHGEHEWSRAQINILKLLAEVIGTAGARERSREDVRYRDVLLAAVNASVVEIMSAPNLHEAVSAALGKVATAVRADRMVVVEVRRTAAGLLAQSVRNSWTTPERTEELAAVLPVITEPRHPELVSWVAPLQHGEAVRARFSLLGTAHQKYFQRLHVQSALLVPIMTNGRYWGHLSFDDCVRERVWTDTEVDILTTLAQLIGTAITRDRYVEELAKANTIVQNSPTILYRLRGEPTAPMIYVSQNISLFGHDAAQWLESPTLYQSFVHADDRAKVQDTMAQLLTSDASPVTIEYRMLNNAGESRWVESRYSPVRDSRTRALEIEGVMIDITERKLAAERIALLARTDVLTCLANRASFSDRLRQSFAAAKRGAGPFAVLYLDLDRFKDVNDMRGHTAGDKLLQAVAQRLRTVTRESDFVARLGGDEFAIVQSDVSDPAYAGALATSVISALSEPYDIDGDQLRIGASAGISVYSSDALAPDSLLAQADQALYRAKEDGRGQFRFHSEALDTQAREYVELADGLRKALEGDGLELYYQSQVDLSSGRVVGMEALIRWNHPTRGLLLPGVFLPVAEKSSVIHSLGRWILNGACRQLAEWRRTGVPVPLIAVNVSLAQIKAGHEFVRDVRDSLSRWRLIPSDLELDVTESALARSTLSQSDVLEELRRLGVRIAIDDFGAQYSSLDYLRTYRVGRLKIARHMVAAASDQSAGQAMVRAIIALAAELDVEVVAEGIETELQRAALVKMSVKTKGQGFYFSQPMTAENTTQNLRLTLKHLPIGDTD
jgi:diguanylate cyclase (GGDEF)-like protein/PAS domain S-box-containing protein